MKITKATTAIKIGDFGLTPNGPKKITLNYLSSISKDILKNSAGRVYLFVKDGEIQKIGGSIDKRGIKGTMNFYVSGARGAPGPSRFILHLLIEDALRKGSCIELYMITSPKSRAKVIGLFGTKIMEVASFKEMEDLCKSDYFSLEKKYPPWNFQENNESYPQDLKRKHTEYNRRRGR